MKIDGVLHSKDQGVLSNAVFSYYNNKRMDRNLVQSQSDGYVHHHFGITGTQIAANASQEQITDELQRQETAQTNYLIDLLGLPQDQDLRIYDVGCGRGGTMFRMLERYPRASVTGINLTEYQTAFCQDQISKRGLQDRAKVVQGSYMDRVFDDAAFTHGIVNEVTPYAYDLDHFFANLARVLVPGGKVALATWAFNDEKDTSQYWRFLVPICEHYASMMHGHTAYRTAMQKHFRITLEVNKNPELVAYWELRKEWKMQSGIEQFFLDAHRNDDLRYLFFVLEKL